MAKELIHDAWGVGKTIAAFQVDGDIDNGDFDVVRLLFTDGTFLAFEAHGDPCACSIKVIVEIPKQRS